MKIRASITNNVNLYDIVTYDESINKWRKASEHEAVLGIVTYIKPSLEEAIIDLNGEFQAYTSRSISPHGGRLSVENGRVFIDNASGSIHRLIFPYAGDLDEDGNVPVGSFVNILI